MPNHFKKLFLFCLLVFLNFSLFSKEAIFFVYTPDRVDNKTASGQVFNKDALTCAHPSLKFGTRIYVTYNGNSVEFRVNDRIKSQNDVFAVTPAVIKQLGAYDLGAIKLSYSIIEQGDDIDEWKNSISDTKWSNLQNILSPNLFETFNNLLTLGYKSCYNPVDNTLIMLNVNKNDYSRAIDTLNLLGVDISDIKSVQLERNPLRQ